MILEKYVPAAKDTWEWNLASFAHVIPITMMANEQYRNEVNGIFTQDVARMARHVDLAVTEQRHTLTQQQLIVAEHKVGKHLRAYAWIARSGYTPYAQEEMAEAKFAHIDLALPITSRVRIMAQILQQWHLWCEICGIPVLVSSTIREDQSGFLKLHDQAGFKRRGSIAYKRIL